MNTETVDGSVDISEAKTLMEVGETFLAQAFRLRSLAAKGYRYTPGVKELETPDPTDESDRDRISAAMMELEGEHNYAAPIACSWEADCVFHASEYLSSHYDQDNVDGALFWFSEVDDEAFGYAGFSHEIREEFIKLPSDGDARDIWLEGNRERILATELSERLQHNHLVAPLSLYWQGDHNLICDVLRKHGLRIETPESEEDYIMVLPSEYEK